MIFHKEAIKADFIKQKQKPVERQNTEIVWSRMQDHQKRPERRNKWTTSTTKQPAWRTRPRPPPERGDVCVHVDDLVLLSPAEQGLQQQLDMVEQFCQNWALAVNMKKTNVMIFQKRPRCQENKHQFTISNHVTEHSMSYTDLGTITITASGSSNMAEMHWKKKSFYNFQIPVKIWHKIFDSIVQPVVLYGTEVWAPLSQQNFTRWDKHPTESLHAEFCRFILHRNTPTNACRAELGRYPLIINIYKRTLNF